MVSLKNRILGLRKYLIGLIISILCKTLLPAQPGPSSFVHYTTDQGLSNDYVKDIVKDRQGFLWVATLNGLNRFDGHSFWQFYHDPNSPNSLPENFVKEITLAPDGSLWTSGNKGICRIDPATLEFRRFLLPENKDTLPNDGVGRVVFDETGMGWVSAEKGLYQFDPTNGSIHFFPLEPEYAGYFDTYLDAAGRLWLIEKEQISYFDTKTKKLRRFDTSSPGSPLHGASVMQVRPDQRGKIWIGTWFKGLFWYDAARDSIFDYPDKKNTLARTILPDASAAGKPYLWLGGGEYGLMVLYPETGEEIQFPPDWQDPFTHNNYLAGSLFKDEKTGDVWIGTETGLEHYAPATLRFGRVVVPIGKEFNQFSLMSGAVQDHTDPSGNTFYIALWGSGIFKWNRRENTFRHFHMKNSGLRNNQVFNIIQDKKGFLWSADVGISRYDPRTGKWRSWPCHSDKFNVDNMMMSCIEDLDGGLWFGANTSGLFHYNPRTDKVVEVSLPSEAYNEKGKLRIFNMCLDPQGRIWMATIHHPIRFDPRTGKVEVFSVKNIEPLFNHWSDVVVGQNGLLYVTAHDCLLELDTNCVVLRKFNQENGLRSNQVYQIVADRQGKIWFNTSHLLHCFDPKTGQFTYFGTADGLFKNTITDGLNMTANGEMFVGFQNAFNFFDPARLRKNLTPPPIVITTTKVMDQERRPEIRQSFHFKGLLVKLERYLRDTVLVVNPGEDIFTIEFAALNFNQPERNRYAYKLEGFNDDWVQTSLNFATYTNLDGGEYLFRVKGANNDGIWNETGAQILVKIIPPLSQRWYFRASLILLIGLVFMGIWHYRRQQRRRLEAFRESLARDLHDEMGSTLSSIRFFSEFAKQKVGNGEAAEATPVLQRISQSASDLSESMQDIIWAMKTKNDQLEDLAARMTEFGLRILEAGNVRFKTHVSENFSGKQLTPEQRRNAYLIFKEAVNNAAKYAEATEVELFLGLKKGLLLMRISDNGKGFDTNAPVSSEGGNGLQNMRMRAAEIGGRVEVVSKIGEGTSVELRVRV
ncbi:MAG: hypothetical protein H6577_11330 [Lewinellaceae bacterium]|nr:hypothetical protein [Saprospiraceae bacterium]MCB9338707.1 hypothetical protein [Lewinellaceae bacterium]